MFLILNLHGDPIDEHNSDIIRAELLACIGGRIMLNYVVL